LVIRGEGVNALTFLLSAGLARPWKNLSAASLSFGDLRGVEASPVLRDEFSDFR